MNQNELLGYENAAALVKDFIDGAITAFQFAENRYETDEIFLFDELKKRKAVICERASVSMGDDVCSPHITAFVYNDGEKISSFLNRIADFVPGMKNVVWSVVCGANTVGYLYSNDDTVYKILLPGKDFSVAQLSEPEVFCRYYYECETDNHALKNASLIEKVMNEEGFFIADYHKKAISEKDGAENGGKGPFDYVSDGILAYGVNVGRVLFENENKTVYVISDLSHNGASDVMTLYQISKNNHLMLLKHSLPDRIPSPPVNSAVTDACHHLFLCSESAHSIRNRFRLNDTDMSLVSDGISFRNGAKICEYCGELTDADGNFCCTCGKKFR